MTNRLVVAIFYSFIYSIGHAQYGDSSNYKFSSAIYDHIKKDSAYWQHGVASSDLSFIGLYKEGLIEHYKTRQKTISKADSINFITNYHTTDARQFILQKAKENQILIFNEAHYNPRNRVFITSLLQDLKKTGFKYFAAETFTNDSTFYGGKPPSFFTGTYTFEPQFGNLVREAVKFNFILYPYEYTGNDYSNGKREIAQARNLQSLLNKDPKAKIIIYCGFDHAREDSVQFWGKAMAGRLKEFTGIDPYTVDQVDLSERSGPAFENPYYRMIHSDKYSILIDSSDNPFTNHHEDVLLYVPRTKYIYNRPGWIFENNKTPYFLNPEEVNISFPILVKAYLNTDDMKIAIPIDVIEIKSKADLPKTAIALFKKGHFIIKIADKKGETQMFKVDK